MAKKPESETPEFMPPLVSYVKNEKFVKKALGFAQTKYQQFVTDIEEMTDLWELLDKMWKCGIKDYSAQDATDNSTSADTGCTLFHRQATRLSSETLSTFLSTDKPFSYTPLYSDNSYMKHEEGVVLAEQYGALARWTMKQDGFLIKFIEGCNLMHKYGNQPAHISWKHETAERLEKIPQFSGEVSEDGTQEITGYEFKKVRKTIANYPTIDFIANTNFMCDRSIGDLQKQSAIFTFSLEPIDFFWKRQQDGIYSNVADIDASDMWGGNGDNDGVDISYLDENKNQESPDDSQTDLYPRWDCYLKLPIGEDGKYDEEKYEPVWFWLTFCGTLTSDPVCVRFIRNPDPDDEAPFFMWHQYADDLNTLYHIAAGQLIVPDYDEQIASKNQLFDNRSKIVDPPKTAIRGEVNVKDLDAINHGDIIWVDNQNSFGYLEHRDATGTCLANIEYCDDDANRVLGTDKVIQGQAMGDRVSATESSNAFTQAKMPHLVNDRYRLEGILGWYARKSMRSWQFYAEPGQVVELTGEELRTEIKPANLWGDFEVLVDVVSNAEMTQQKVNAISFTMQAFMQNPEFNKYIDAPELMREFVELSGWKNAKWIKSKNNFDAKRSARNAAHSILGGSYVPADPQEDHQVYLDEYENLKAQYKSVDNAYQEVPGLSMLDYAIEERKQLMAQQQQAQAQQQMAQIAGAGAMGQPTSGMQQGQTIAAQEGAMTPQ